MYNRLVLTLHNKGKGFKRRFTVIILGIKSAAIERKIFSHNDLTVQDNSTNKWSSPPMPSQKDQPDLIMIIIKYL